MNNLRNKVQLIGFLGKDPDVRVLESGTISRFSIATNETYRNASGEKVTSTTWHSVVAWNKLAELSEKLLKKGTEVVIEGKLVNRNYEDAQGVRKYITEILAYEMVLVGSRPDSKDEFLEEESELNFPVES